MSYTFRSLSFLPYETADQVGAGGALAQAGMAPVVAGSAFAILQSAGMGGIGLIVVKTIAASGAVAATCSTAAVSFLKAMEGATKEEMCRRDVIEEQDEYEDKV
jgi:hypothetical protein